jgi:hypothetical protein
LNPLTPWTRPPIQNVYCVYGLDLKTEIGYHFAPSGKPYPDNWVISDIIFENEGGTLQSRSGVRVSGTSSPASGDISVPYNSLSYCKTWLGPQVNITRTPQVFPYPLLLYVTNFCLTSNCTHNFYGGMVPCLLLSNIDCKAKSLAGEQLSWRWTKV